MRGPIEELRGSLQSFKTLPRLTLFRRIERWAWAAPAWVLVAAIFENIIALSLRAELFGNGNVRSAYRAIARSARQVAAFGRPLSDELQEKVKILSTQNLSQDLIRDGVLGRIFRADGTIDLRARRYLLLRILGSIWHVISFVSVSCLIVLAAILPGFTLTKVSVAIVLLTFLLFSIAFINAITLRTSYAFMRVLSMSAGESRRSTLRSVA